MASTRDKNSPEYFQKERHEIQKAQKYQLYENAPNAPAHRSLLPGDGLGVPRMASTELSTNAVDIETRLLGIGSCSVIPRNLSTPELRPLPSLDIYDKPRPIVPRWGEPMTHQRPFYRGEQTILPRYVQIEMENRKTVASPIFPSFI